MATRKGIANVFRLLDSLGYPNPTRTAAELDEHLTAWTMVCEHVTDDELKAGALSFVRSDKYRQWPVPGSILTMVEDIVTSAGMSADEAWGHVQTMIGRHGTQYAVPGRDFSMHDDPALAERILKALSPLGGWRGVGLLQEGDSYARDTFRKAWNAAEDRQRVGRRLGVTATGVPLLEVK